MLDPRFSTMALLRYREVDALLRKGNYPDVEVLREAIAHVGAASGKKTKVSRDLVVRILRSMKQEMDAPIKYSRSKNGYYYSDPEFRLEDRPLTKEELDAMLMASESLSQATANPVFQHMHSAVEKMAEHLEHKDLLKEGGKQVMMVESAPRTKGSEYLGELVKAITQRKLVTIEYQRFGSDESEPRTLVPLLLKQYRHRWYLLAQDYLKEKIRTFGLDRIRSLEVSSSESPNKVDFDARTYFQHSLGITAFEGTPQNILLKVDPLTKAYLESQPLHESQRLEKKKDGYLLHLFLLPSEELIREILAMGSQVEVLSPDSLRAEVARRVRDMHSLYEARQDE